MTTTAAAQWANHPMKNVPRTPDGKVDLNAPPRRTADGKIDLSGFWMPTNPVKHLLNLAADLKPGSVPLQPWAEAVYKERIETNGKDHPGVRCWPSGIPEKLNIPDGLKLVQTPEVMIFLHESRTIYRQVFTDGRKLPRVPEDAQPMWMGYSVGRWEGDTFIVETIGQNGKTWLDMRGLPATEALQRDRTLHPADDRPRSISTSPSTIRRPIRSRGTSGSRGTCKPDWELIESICEENNRDLPHMVGK